MTFIKYQHIERITDEGITFNEELLKGTCYVFPKLDGACHSVWYDDEKKKVMCASRNQVLSEGYDTTGFWKYCNTHKELEMFCIDHPGFVLYGEFLTPHTIKDYQLDAWNKFYVFDVMYKDSFRYVPYYAYAEELRPYGISFIPPLAKIDCSENPYEEIKALAEDNHYLMKDNLIGEGVVVKNYDMSHCQIWGKVVRAEFKDKFGAKIRDDNDPGHKEIYKTLNETLTPFYVDKEYHKYVDEHGALTTKDIGDFLKYIWEQWWIDFSYEYIGTKKYILDVRYMKSTASKMVMKMIHDKIQ